MTISGLRGASLVAWLCSIAAGLLGTMVILGWILEIRVLLEVTPGAASMKFNTALGLVLAAAALQGFTRRASVTAVVGLVLLLLGGLTLLDSTGLWRTRLDEILVDDWIASDTPGRMGMNSATCFVVLGTAYLSLTMARTPIGLTALVGAVGILSISLAALLGYASGLELVYRWGGASRMSLNTAVAFLLLGTGLLAAGWDRIERRRQAWFAIGLAGCVAGITLVVWVGVRSEQERLSVLQARNAAQGVADLTSKRVAEILAALTRLDERWNGDCSAACQRDVTSYFHDYPELTNLGWIGSGAAAVTAYQREANGGLRIGDSVAVDRLSQAVNTLAPVSGLPWSATTRATEGGPQLTVTLQDDSRSHVLATTIDAKRLIALLLDGTSASGRVHVSLRGQEVLSAATGPGSGSDEARAIVSTSIVGVPWAFAAMTEEATIHGADWLLFGGLLIAGFVGASAYLWQTGRAHLAQIRVLNATLETRVAERTRDLAIANADLEQAVLHESAALSRLTESEHRFRELAETLETRVQQRTAELARANESVADARARLQSVLDSATQISIIATDPEGIIRVFNAGAERMLQYSAAEMVDVRTPAIIHDPVECAERGRQMSEERGRPITGFDIFVEYARERPFDEREWTYLRKDGSRLSVNLVVTAVRDGLGGITGYLGIATDITARKRLEAELRDQHQSLEEQTRRAEDANRAKSEFLAAMSHEIRTPMNAILGMADLLWESSLDAEQRHYVEVFRRAGNNLLALINDILDLSKIESGRFELETVPFALNDVVDQTMELIAPRVRAKGLTLSLNRSPGLPAALAGDPLRLRQVLVNLLGNAVKFTERGGITLSIRSETPGRPGRLVFDVTDTGIGIPEEQLHRIFEDFTQADASTARTYGGTGLGLGISLRLVHLMGGDLTATSRVGIGSTFTFSATFDVVADRAASRELKDLHGHRVLVIDDDATNRLVLREALSGWGVESREFEAPAEALSDLARALDQKVPYALVLVDSQMPGMDGFEAARRVRELAPDLPVVMLASDAERGDESRRAGAGVAGFAMKPVNRAQLLRVICDAMNVSLVGEAAVGAEPPGVTMQPLSILVAEDFADNRVLMQAYLKGSPYQLAFAENGHDAVEMFAERQFDLVLMDIQMPGMDGLAATRAIRRFEQEHGRRPTPIVALTANARPSDVQASRDAGCDRHLSKPIAKRSLLRTIADIGAQRVQESDAGVIDVQMPEGLEELGADYLAARRREMDELERVARANEFDRVRIIGHNLAGSGSAYGFDGVSEIGRSLEDAARANDRDDVLRRVAELRRFLRAVRVTAS